MIDDIIYNFEKPCFSQSSFLKDLLIFAIETRNPKNQIVPISYYIYALPFFINICMI